MQAWEEKILDKREARKEGLAEGREEGLIAFIKSMTELGISQDVVEKKLRENFSLTDERIREYIEKYMVIKEN